VRGASVDIAAFREARGEVEVNVDWRCWRDVDGRARDSALAVTTPHVPPEAYRPVASTRGSEGTPSRIVIGDSIITAPLSALSIANLAS